MSYILMRLLETDNSTILPIIGLDGVGKSALAKSILHYAADRKYFTGGIIMIQLQSVRNTFELIKHLRETIINCLQLSKE